MRVRDQVLIVDESPLVRRLLRSALEDAEYWVHEAKNAAAARQLISVRSYDLFVGGRIGLDLLPLARSAGAAVIALTASRPADLHILALELDVDACFATQEGFAQAVVRSARRLLQAPATPIRTSPVGLARPFAAA